MVLTSGYDDASLFPQAFRELPRISKPFDQGTLHRVCVTTIGMALTLHEGTAPARERGVGVLGRERGRARAQPPRW